MFEKPILKLVKFNVMDICAASSGTTEEPQPSCGTVTPDQPIPN